MADLANEHKKSPFDAYSFIVLVIEYKKRWWNRLPLIFDFCNGYNNFLVFLVINLTMAATIVHLEESQTESNATHPSKQKESGEETIVGLEREDHPHDAAKKQYSWHKAGV